MARLDAHRLGRRLAEPGGDVRRAGGLGRGADRRRGGRGRRRCGQPAHRRRDDAGLALPGPVGHEGCGPRPWCCRLVDEGRLSLDDPVSRHLPRFRTADEEQSAAITVRHLLTHTGGFEGDLWPDVRDDRRRLGETRRPARRQCPAAPAARPPVLLLQRRDGRARPPGRGHPGAVVRRGAAPSSRRPARRARPRGGRRGGPGTPQRDRPRGRPGRAARAPVANLGADARLQPRRRQLAGDAGARPGRPGPHAPRRRGRPRRGAAAVARQRPADAHRAGAGAGERRCPAGTGLAAAGAGCGRARWRRDRLRRDAAHRPRRGGRGGRAGQRRPDVRADLDVVRGACWTAWPSCLRPRGCPLGRGPTRRRTSGRMRCATRSPRSPPTTRDGCG
ncbi:serine hydrolase domain-containing protein [Nocardioides convexus]|uniref:serine hydrolase n=1 Tax=Nocardioides convexus TaxID=2712224 RepID=UPI0024188683|nr:serine hydrolase domain-containing protein [Nocardioides convexus]